MSETSSVEIAMRIPGVWSGPQEFMERLPDGYRMTEAGMVLPDGSLVEFGAAGADDQFAEIFRTSLRQEPTEEELATVENYAVNILLCGPGGSMESARTMMQAAAAVIRAGGAGVFIDNCGLAHGGSNWLAIIEDGGTDALSFAFTAIIRGGDEIYTVGLHALGLRDIVMKRSDVEEGGFDIVEVIRYVAAGEKPIEDGHILADLDGPRFTVRTIESNPETARSPMHNPFGRLKLVSIKDIAETN